MEDRSFNRGFPSSVRCSIQHCQLRYYLHHVDILLINTWMDGWMDISQRDRHECIVWTTQCLHVHNVSTNVCVCVSHTHTHTHRQTDRQTDIQTQLLLLLLLARITQQQHCSCQRAACTTQPSLTLTHTGAHWQCVCVCECTRVNSVCLCQLDSSGVCYAGLRHN